MPNPTSIFASFLITPALVVVALFSSAALAKDYVYEIKGMKCGACVDSIKEKVCSQKGITKCDVEVGKMSLTVDDKVALSEEKISTLVKEAGHFKVVGVTDQSKLLDKKTTKSSGAKVEVTAPATPVTPEKGH